MGSERLEPGGGLAGRFSTTSSSRRQCWWWGRIWFISHCDSFYKLCSVSLRLRLPEQTETGAIRGSCSQRHIQYTTSIGFAFFDSIVGWYIFGMYEDGSIYKRRAIGCVSWWMFSRNHRGIQISLPLIAT